MTLSPEYLRFSQISKIYPGVKALQQVSFGVREGSVHALLGENGAGKSTLLKALSGAHQPTEGEILLNGAAKVFRGTSDAIAAGIAVIYQELHLVPEMSVAENIFLGHLPTSGPIINRPALLAETRKLLDLVGEPIDPRARVGRLSLGQRQMVEIAKALSRGAKVIAFDEPTSSLSAREISRLFDVIRDLQSKRCAILYVTHRMEEVFKICDSATVLRDGKHVVSWNSMQEVTHEKIVKAMVGRDIADIYGYRPRPKGEVALEVRALEGPGLRAPVSLNVARGEIVGLFGLVGAGRTETLKLIYGAVPRKAGSISVHGTPADARTPGDAVRQGIILCPEDRKKEGIIPVGSVMENINISARRNTALAGLVINPAWERSNAAAKVKELGVRTPTLRQQIQFLSGGNQQKAILGRWLSERIKVIMLDEPTRGIDVGAKNEIYSIIYRLAESGIAVIAVSSDLPEVLGISDRVIVMREGRIAGELPRENATPERVMALALPVSGIAPPETTTPQTAPPATPQGNLN
jgi:L-arabinose transport system ATP-binding protein